MKYILLTLTLILLSTSIYVKAQESYIITLDNTLIPSTDAHLDQDASRSPIGGHTYFMNGQDTNRLHGFVYTVHLAFQNHLTLVIKPTDIWQTILFTLSNHIADHAESLRSLFVTFDGKQQITVNRDDWSGLEHTKQEWESVVQEITDKLAQQMSNTTASFVDAFIGDFPTVSTIDTRILSKLSLMSSMQHYFNYVVETLCGIPKVEMLGTIADWEMLNSKLDQLDLLNPLFQDKLVKWHQSLKYIVNKMIDSRKGSVDVTFWKSFYKYRSGSGGNRFDGIILYLFNHPEATAIELLRQEAEDDSEDGEHQLYFSGIQSVPDGLVKIPFEWKTMNGDQQLDIYAGFGDPVIVHDKVETSLFWKIMDQGATREKSAAERMREWMKKWEKREEIEYKSKIDELRQAVFELLRSHPNNIMDAYNLLQHLKPMDDYELIQFLFPMTQDRIDDIKQLYEEGASFETYIRLNKTLFSQVLYHHINRIYDDRDVYDYSSSDYQNKIINKQRLGEHLDYIIKTKKIVSSWPELDPDVKIEL